MNELHLLLIIHLLCATIWVGGHILVSGIVLPQVWKKKDTGLLFDFEEKYEKIGMPTLLLLVITGIRMAYMYNVRVGNWFSFSFPIEKVVSLKLMCLFGIVLLALSAQLYVLPALKKNIKMLPLMTIHVLLVTLLSIAMLILGSFVRYGGI